MPESWMRKSVNPARSLARLKLVSRAAKLIGRALPSMLLGSDFRVSMALLDSGTLLDSPFLVRAK